MRPPTSAPAPCTRRAFLGALAPIALAPIALAPIALAPIALAGCGSFEAGAKQPGQPRQQGRRDPARLTARPAPTGTRGALRPGLDALDTGGAREVLIYVPQGYTPDRPAPLAVALHGAGQTARTGVAPLRPHADALGLVLVAPQSIGQTWDFVRGGYGPDVEALDRTLAQLFRDVAVDPARVALTGFSDGASYALSLGLTNGDLFTRVVAFSPCILAPAAYRGRPSLFVSHGTRDAILEIGPCSRRLVPALRGDGYDVTYREFDGPHTVPSEIAAEAAAFICKG